MDSSLAHGHRPMARSARLRQALHDRTAALFGRRNGLAAPGMAMSAMTPAEVPPLDVLGPASPPRMPPLEALALDGVSHRYGRTLALDGVSLTIGAGEIVCLVGHSGCGKSTLLRLAAGLEPLQHGSVRIGGRVVADGNGSLPPEKRGIGLVFQDYALFPHLSVLDNVRFGLSGQPAETRRQRAMASLEQVGMADYATAFPHALSGGQQQRVALARALAPNPSVLLLDEPFSGLDARLRERVRDETLHVLKRNGAATMLVTHDPEEAMFLADRIALMRKGRIVQTGSPVDLYTAPATSFAAAFFGEVNRLSGTVRDGRVDTPLGPVPVAPGRVGEGEAAEILIRPEALHLTVPPRSAAPGGEGHPARVMAARLLGRSSLIHLSMADGKGGTMHLHARTPGPFLPPEDSCVAVTLDRRQAFVFAAKETA